ncbi:MAG: O-antigen ligase family protein [Patescibacteria group bacterium]
MEMLKKIIKYLLFATALTPLIISDRFLYPFIVPRTGFFYFMVELAIILFLSLFISGKIGNWQMRGNYLFLAFFLFLGVNVISAFLGESLQVSFFSSIERSWGVLMIAHLCLFFFLLRSFFEKKEWILYFKLSVLVSVVVSIIGILQRFGSDIGITIFLSGDKQIISTLGNSTYVAIYLLFNIFFALYLLMQKKDGRENWIFFLPILINFFAFTLTGTRGAYLGLIAGIFISGILYLFLGGVRKYKIVISTTLLVLTALLSITFIFPQSLFVQNAPILNRLSSISLTGGTTETRLISWQAVLSGFKDNPILGVGPENYNIVFNKYLISDYYTYAPTEPYFDRAHNSFLDVLATTGLAGFIVYLSFVFFIFFFLWKMYKEEKIDLKFLMLFTTLSVAYFVHIFFVFDDVNSFIFFIILMAFLEFNRKKKLIISDDSFVKADDFKKTIAMAFILLSLWAGYQYDVKVLRSAKLANDAFLANDFKDMILSYDRAIDVDSTPKKDIIFSYVDSLYNLSLKYDEISKNKDNDKIFKDALISARDALDKEININPNDALIYLKYSLINNAFYIAYDDEKYINEAISAMYRAISLSKERPQYYHILSDIYILSNQVDKAVESSEFALNMNKNYNASYFYLAKAYALRGQLDEAFNNIKKAIEMDYEPDENTILFLAKEFANKKELEKAIEMYNIVLKFNPKSSQAFVKLTILYIEMSDKKNAIESAKKAAEVNPELKNDASYIISQIESGNMKALLNKLK